MDSERVLERQTVVVRDGEIANVGPVEQLVTLYTESLLENEPNLSARARNYLQTIQRAIHDVAETVDRMREFCRPREPQTTLAPVHLNRLVQQVIDLTRSRWSNMPQQQGIMIQMQTELSPDLPAIMGIESEIRDALTNLIFNAVDAMPKGGTLTLRTRIGARAPSSEESPALRPVHVKIKSVGVTGACLQKSPVRLPLSRPHLIYFTVNSKVFVRPAS